MKITKRITKLNAELAGRMPARKRRGLEAHLVQLEEKRKAKQEAKATK